MARQGRHIRGWLRLWVSVSIALGAVTTYAVALALPHLTPVQRYQLITDDAAREAAASAGFFCARFESFGVRRVSFDQRLGDRQPVQQEETSAFVRRGTDVGEGSADLLVRPTRVGAWSEVKVETAARPDLCYIVASGWPLAALRGRVDYQLAQPSATRVNWFADGTTKPTMTAGAMVTAPPTPVRLNLGPAIVPLQPTRFGFAVNTVLMSALWFALFGGLALGKRQLRSRRGGCPRCGYDLRQCETPGCPECGWKRA